MFRNLLKITAFMFVFGFIIPDIANAARICTVYSVGATTKGHKTERGAEARAWVNWQGKMRNKHGRRFSVAMAQRMPGFPESRRDGRFNHSARVAARGCFIEAVSCITGTGITPTCKCQSSLQRAKQQGCTYYQAGR